MRVLPKCNNEIRQRMKQSGVPQWAVAEKLGMSEFDMSRKMRHELSPEDKVEVLAIIEQIAQEGGAR